MFISDITRIRQLGIPGILKTCIVKKSTPTIATTNTHIFNLQVFDHFAMDYIDLIMWENVTEPPLTKQFSDAMIFESLDW